MIENLVLGIIGTICTLWVAGLQLTVRKMEKQLAECVTKREARELISDKLENHVYQLKDLKQDLEKIEAKLDRILEEKTH